MKVATFPLLIGATTAFTSRGIISSASRSSCLQQLNMFSGAGEGIPGEDDPEELAKMEQSAKQLGMTLDEYKLGMGARIRMTKEIDGARLMSGDKKTVGVERDGNNPPKFLEIIITEEGKALGKDAVESMIVAAWKESEEASKVARVQAQKGMMSFVAEEMKKIG